MTSISRGTAAHRRLPEKVPTNYSNPQLILSHMSRFSVNLSFAIAPLVRCCAAKVKVSLVIWALLMLVGLSGCRTFHQQNLTQLQKARRTAEIFAYGAPSMVQVKPIRRSAALNPVTKGTQLQFDRTRCHRS